VHVTRRSSRRPGIWRQQAGSKKKKAAAAAESRARSRSRRKGREIKGNVVQTPKGDVKKFALLGTLTAQTTAAPAGTRPA
jgi:hypothetical protein